MEVHLPHYDARKKKRRKNYFQIWSEDLCCVLAINVLMFCFCWMWEILFSIGSVLELSCEEDRDGLCLKVLLLSSQKDACGLAGSWPRCLDFAGYTSPLPSVWPRALGGVGMWGGLIPGAQTSTMGDFFIWNNENFAPRRACMLVTVLEPDLLWEVWKPPTCSQAHTGGSADDATVTLEEGWRLVVFDGSAQFIAPGGEHLQQSRTSPLGGWRKPRLLCNNRFSHPTRLKDLEEVLTFLRN